MVMSFRFKGIEAFFKTVAETARQLRVSRVQPSRVLHGHSPVSPNLALLLTNAQHQHGLRLTTQDKSNPLTRN
jgi:hypothetical protein